MRAIAVAGALLLLAGCSGFRSTQGTGQVYTLTAPLPQAVASADTMPAATLRLARPLAAPGLDTDRIALTRSGQRLDYYTASRWSAEVPALVHALAVEALRGAGRFGAVQPDGAHFDASYLLQIEVLRFQADYADAGPPTVHVQLLATLGRQDDRKLIATVVADSSVVASANRMEAVVGAFQAATSEALGQLAARLQPPP